MGAREDEVLARLALDRGLITLEQLSEARVRQRALGEAGEDVDIARALVESGFITDDDAYDLILATELEAGEIRRSTYDTPATGFATDEPYSQGGTPTLKLPAQGPRDPSRTIGAYRIVEKVGGGATGEVYKARKPGTDRFFAVKVLSPSEASAEFTARFKREVEVACRLNHANVVRCVEFGYDPWRKSHFYVMHFVDGETLRSRVERTGPLGEHEALVTARQVAIALHYAYVNDLVHRDVKPENVMLTSTGRVKLLELGLPRPVTHGSPRTSRPGSSPSSPHYASPEQAHGESPIDVRSDIYSLGGTLYYMVTGEAPFAGERAPDVVAGHIRWPSELNPEISEGLCLIIAKAMAKDPDQRYQTPLSFSLDLDIILHGIEPVIARKAPPDSTVARSAAGKDSLDSPVARAVRPRRHSRTGRATSPGSQSGTGGAGRKLPGLHRPRAGAAPEEGDRAPSAATRRTYRLGERVRSGDEAEGHARGRRARPDRAGREAAEERAYEAAAAADLEPVASEKGFLLFACLLIGGLLAIVVISLVSGPDDELSPKTADIPEDAVEFRGHSYKLFVERKTWSQAKEFCEEQGGHLVAIGSKEENDFVKGVLKGAGQLASGSAGARLSAGPAWIGLTDEREEGEFEWVTGEPVTFKGWGGGEPDDRGDHLRGGNTRARTVMSFICEWDEATAGVSSGGLAAEYFADKEFRRSVLRRIDRNVDFDWGARSPAPGVVPEDDFSVRWEGHVSPPSSGEYVFTTVCDDNARLWIDGRLIVEDWPDPHPSRTTHSKPLELEGGELYALRLEFREFGGDAVMRLQWKGPGFERQAVPPARFHRPKPAGQEERF